MWGYNIYIYYIAYDTLYLWWMYGGLRRITGLYLIFMVDIMDITNGIYSRMIHGLWRIEPTINRRFNGWIMEIQWIQVESYGTCWFQESDVRTTVRISCFQGPQLPEWHLEIVKITGNQAAADVPSNSLGTFDVYIGQIHWRSTDSSVPSSFSVINRLSFGWKWPCFCWSTP